jgi:ABC-type polysaccharide/polyol phosphate export permease
MEKKGQYRRTNFGMLWFVINLIMGAYLILKGLTFITFSFITDSLNNIIIIVAGALVIIGGFLYMRNNAFMQRIR